MNIYSITDDKKSIKLQIELESNYCSLVSSQSDMSFMFGLLSEKNEIDVIKLENYTPIVINSVKLSSKIDFLRSFIMGGKTHLVGYNGHTLTFYTVSINGNITQIYSYTRAYGFVTTGFTVVEPYYYRDKMLMLCYNETNGDAQVYDITVPPMSEMEITIVWQKQWAKQWKRFALFKLGGENFFLKTNTDHKKVNIDHFMDNAAEGSHPVNTHLDLPMDLTDVKTYYPNHNAGFITYRKSDGILTLNTIWGDCSGWETSLSQKITENKNGICVPENISRDILIVY